MKKIHYLLFLYFLVSYNLYAQIPQPAQPRDYFRRISIDTVSLQVTYSCSILRILGTESYSSDIQILEKGRTYCRYYSRNAELVDSIFTHMRGNTNLGRDSEGNYREGTYEDIYINYPKSGDMSVITRFLKKNFLYTEEIPEQEWTLSSETDTILGYQCFKAIADFRGRTWHAWFAPDIPLNLGPWKLSGLPGLILKAEDSDSNFTYEAIGLIQNSGNPIIMYDEKFQKCRRDDVLMLNDLRWKDDDFLLKITYGAETVSFEQNDLGNAVRSYRKSDAVIPQKELN